MAKSTCTIDNCERPVHGRGWCGAHWMRNKRYGHPLAGGKDRKPQSATCEREGCERKPVGRNLCNTHWKAQRASEDPEYRAKRKAEWDRWAEQNKERLAEYDAAYRVDNAEQISQWLREWKDKNPGSTSLYTYTKRRRRYQMENLIVDVVEPGVLFERDGGMCQLCRDSVDPSIPFPDPMSQTMDHIIPVSDERCEHSYANTQLAHWDCNRKKRDTVVPAALRSLGELAP